MKLMIIYGYIFVVEILKILNIWSRHVPIQSNTVECGSDRRHFVCSGLIQ